MIRQAAMKKTFKDLLCYALIGILYLFAVIKVSIDPMHVPVTDWQLLLLAAGAIIVLMLIFSRIGRIAFLSGVVVGVGFLVYSVIKEGFEELPLIFAPVRQLVKVMIQVGTGYYNDKISFAWLMISIEVFAILVAIPIYFFLIRKLRFCLLMVPGFVLFITVWGFTRYVQELSFYAFIMVVIVCYILHNYHNHLRKTGDSASSKTNGNIMLYFAPVAVLTILLSTAFKVNPLPVQWPWLDQKISTIYWDLHTKYSIDRYDKFSLANTGFGDASHLGGPVYPDNTPIMLVQAPARVYLRGAVYDQYDGSGWQLSERTKEDYLDDRILDHHELRYGWKSFSTLYDIYTLDAYSDYLENGLYDLQLDPAETEEYVTFLKMNQIPQTLSKLYPEEQITITHQHIRTKSLFTPLKIFLPISLLDGYTLTENTEGIMEADVRLMGDTTYKMSYLQPAYGMEELTNYFSGFRSGMYEEFNDINSQFIRSLDDSTIENAKAVKDSLTDMVKLYEMLEARRNEIHDLYMQIPEGIPERVGQLAKEMTAGINTPYAKVKQIEAFLRENYRYTLTPNAPPLDQDFIDYFLFEGKEGYCAYYASALCIMSRAAGIPARYVEGFVLPEAPDENGYYHVTNQNAHAWVEAYIEGAGWVTFEPTAPMAGAMNYSVILEETESDYSLEMEMPDFYEEWYRRDPVDLDRHVIERDNPKITMEIVLFWALIGILAVLLMNWLFVMIRRRVLLMMDPKKSVLFLYRHMETLLGHTKCGIKTGETPRDYAGRVDERYQGLRMSMTEMVELFYSVRFGGHTLDKNSMKSLIKFEKEIKARTGRSMYFPKRILLRGLLFQG